MAIVENFWLKNQRKRLAGAVIYQAMGQTRSRELAVSVTNPRTPAQMSQRVRWANCVNIYRVNSNWMKFAYETKKQNQTDYNKFMSLNVASSYIFLTKQIAQSGGCVAAPYIMSQGSLPSISAVPQGRGWATNIYIGDLELADDNLTVAQVSNALLDNNPGLQEGDQLSLIFNIQQFNQDNGFPYVLLRKYEFLIDKSNTRKFYDYWPQDHISSDIQANQNVITIISAQWQGTFCVILSRTIGGKTFVSTQKSINMNNTETINQYASEAAMQRAIDSYGREEDVFLTTTQANETTTGQLPNQIISININGNIYLPGQNVPLIGVEGGDPIDAVFQNITSGTTATGVLTTSLRQRIMLDFDDAGPSLIHFSVPTSTVFANNEALQTMAVSIGGETYEIGFFVRNDQTIGGLE